MYNIESILSSLGRSTTDESLTRELRKWQAEVYGALRRAGKADDAAVRFGGSLPMHLLRPEDEIRLMGDYRKIIGLDDVLTHLGSSGPNKPLKYLEKLGLPEATNQQISNVWKQLSAGKLKGGDNTPMGRFMLEDNNTMLSKVYSAINLQFYERARASKTGQIKPTGLASDHFAVGSIPKLETLTRPPMIPTSLAGKNILTFDLETAGLRTGSVRELAWESVTHGDPSTKRAGRTVFRPGQGQRGVIVKDGRVVNTDVFLEGKAKTPVSSGDDFLKGALEFIERAKKADVVAGHNIAGFDMGQIFRGIAGTSRYQSDDVFRASMDEAYDQLSGKVVDTLELARAAPNLRGLKVSKALKDGRAYSIENLLLKTDLAERIGPENVQRIIAEGLHGGTVDTPVTYGLLENLYDLQKVDVADTGLTPETAAQLTKSIQKSAAITPLTNIRKKKNIHSRIFDMLGKNAIVNPLEQEMLLQRDLGMVDAGAAKKVMDGLPSRDLLSTLGGFDRLSGRAGRPYADMYDVGEKPTTRAFADYRNTLKAKGFGFAGLSYEERFFGTAMSSLTSRVGNNPMGNLARESLVSRFETFSPDSIQWLSDSGKITLPPQMLENAGLLRKGSLLDLSIVEPTRNRPESSVNLAYRFDGKKDVEKIAEVFDTIDRDGIEAFAKATSLDAESPTTKIAYENFKKALGGKTPLKEALSKTGTKIGVNIGQLQGDVADEAIELIKRLNITDSRLKDDKMLRMLFPYMGREDGVIKTAGTVYGRGLRKIDREAVIPRQVDLIEAMFSDPKKGMRGLMGNDAKLAAAAESIDSARSMGDVGRVMKANEAISNKVLPKLPKWGLGALAAGVGLWAYSNRKENAKYDAAFDYVPPEPGPSRYALADVLAARVEAGENGYRQQIDPLATASLSDHLYYSSVGHTNMSWDRNSTLYGGVL